MARCGENVLLNIECQEW
jgi:hypothetical protein